MADSPIYVIYHDPCMDGFSAPGAPARSSATPPPTSPPGTANPTYKAIGYEPVCDVDEYVNISSEGGVPLRIENYSNWTPINNLVADGVRCKNGHDAVYMNPHGARHGKVTIRNVVADSCESALSLKGDGSFGKPHGGRTPL